MPDPIPKKITVCVLCTHAIFLGVVLFGSGLLPEKKKHKPLIVTTIVPKTVQATYAPPKKAAAPAKAAPAAVAPKPKAAPTPKPVAPKPPVKAEPKKDPAIADKTISKSKTPPPKKEVKPDNRAKISDNLKRELEQSIANMEGKKQPVALKNSTTFTPIQLQIDSMDSNATESDYPNHMVQYLHQSLNLPEFGEVKIQLTLRQDGSVVKLVVLKTESEKNRSYLEGSLPHLRFPPFSGSLSKAKEHTFVLTFCNEL